MKAESVQLNHSVLPVVWTVEEEQKCSVRLFARY